MVQKEIILSTEGKKKLEERLDYLENVKKHEIAMKIKTAREFGDLSENAEYTEAKEEQGFIEGEIRDIKYKLEHAKVFDESAGSNGTVMLGSKVRVFDRTYEEEDVYTIVGSEEVDLMKLKISNESPIGSALLGKVAGDVVTISTPGGTDELEILEVL